MKTNLIGLLVQSAASIDPDKDTGAYAYMLGEEVVSHLRDVKAGKHTAQEFAEFYCFAPDPTPSQTVSQDRAVEAMGPSQLIPSSASYMADAFAETVHIQQLRAIVTKHTRVGGYPDTMGIAQDAYQAALATGAVEALRDAVKEGLICIHADIEERKLELLDAECDPPEDDYLLDALKERRARMEAALAAFKKSEVGHE